ncbi:MAG: HAMP domain-containing sensor histidine kinase [Pseudomonadota bacterium]
MKSGHERPDFQEDIIAEPDLGVRKAARPGLAKLDRSKLVVPVLVILLICFLSIIGFVWSGTRSLNREAVTADRQLVGSMLTIQWNSLQGVIDFAVDQAGGYVGLPGKIDEGWATLTLGESLHRDFAIASAWLLPHDGAESRGFLQGQVTDVSFAQLFSPELEDWISESLSPVGEEGKPRTGPVRTFARMGDDIQFLIAQRVALSDAQSNAVETYGPILVLTLPLADSFPLRDPLSRALENLSADVGLVPEGHASVPLFGFDGHTLGHLQWTFEPPGDRFLRPLSPLIGIGLIAIAYFLLQFIRGADLFMERQASLTKALQHEQNLRAMKSRFISMVSHELRTPLAAIRAATELLERYGERMTEKDREDEYRAIHKGVDALSKLVDNVLVLAKSDWVETGSAAEDIEMAAFVRLVWDETVGPFYEDHRLDVNEEGDVGFYRGDPVYLRALLSNLYQNAVKYSRGGDKVEVLLSYEPGSLTLQVRDHGMGIPEEAASIVFEPFRRAKNAESMTGSGLGLAVARSAVKSMGGEISFKSALGEGTTFTIVLPRPSAEQEANAGRDLTESAA